MILTNFTSAKKNFDSYADLQRWYSFCTPHRIMLHRNYLLDGPPQCYNVIIWPHHPGNSVIIWEDHPTSSAVTLYKYDPLCLWVESRKFHTPSTSHNPTIRAGLPFWQGSQKQQHILVICNINFKELIERGKKTLSGVWSTNISQKYFFS